MTTIKDQKEFMWAANQTTDILNYNQLYLYRTLIEEEAKEFLEENSLTNAVKEALDLVVVSLGFLHSTGIDVQKAWDLVHENNMLKVRTKPEYDENGKVKKSTASIAAKKEMMEKIKTLIEEVKND